MVWVGRFSKNVTCDDDFQENWTGLYKAGTPQGQSTQNQLLLPLAETAEESRRRKRKQKTSGASSTHNGELRRCMSSVMSFISNSLNVCLILFCVFTEFLLRI